MFSVRYEGCPRVLEMPLETQSVNPTLAAEVGKIWDEAQAEQGAALFNGLIFSVTDITGSLITGYFVEYKYFVAVRRRPELFSELQVRPLAVTGLSRCDGGIILGRRSAHVTQDRGLWECVPSGGIDRSSRQADGSINIAHQIGQELSEETGLRPELITNVCPRYVIEDSSSHLFDIVADVVLNLSTEEAKSALDNMSSVEYDKFNVLDIEGAKSFFKDDQGRIAPLSRYLVEELEMLEVI